MVRGQGKPRVSGGGTGFGSPAFGRSSPSAAGVGAFASPAGGNGLSYLAEAPDLSAVSDPNVVVAFKNVLKKDPATKAKGLQELVAHAQATPFEKDGGVEEAVLEAWTSLYARTSMDNSRRVRELSHMLQLDLMKSARKRMERRLPSTIAAWLAGTFDRDRGVAKAASDGLSGYLTTADKARQVWARCQAQIAAFASDALRETPSTLSDDRTTSADDAEAKHHRVLAAGLSLVLGLLQRLDAAELDAQAPLYADLLGSDAVWACAAGVPDAFVRRTAHQLLGLALDKRPDELSAARAKLRRAFVMDGLKSDQRGSMVDYVRALTKLTTRMPEVWEAAGSSTGGGAKKTPLARLQPLLERGSRDWSPQYWGYLSELIAAMPQQVPLEPNAARDAMKALRKGVAAPDEPRSNAVAAWGCYLRVVEYLAGLLGKEEEREALVKEEVLPLLGAYLFQGGNTTPFSTGANVKIVAAAYALAAKAAGGGATGALRQELQSLADQLGERAARSLPESSADYDKSQDAVAGEGLRWFTLMGTVAAAYVGVGAEAEKVPNLMDAPSVALLARCLSTLEKRNLKPFGAAATLRSALDKVPELFVKSNETMDAFGKLLRPENMGALVKSKSADYLLACVDMVGRTAELQKHYEKLWNAVAPAMTSTKTPSAGMRKLLVSKAAVPLARSDVLVQQYLRRLCLNTAEGLDGSSGDWELFREVFAHGILTDESATAVVKGIVELLEEAETGISSAVRALADIADLQPKLVSVDAHLQMALFSRALTLMGVSDAATSSDATTLLEVLEKTTGDDTAVLKLIQGHLQDTEAVGVDVLVQQALKLRDGKGVALEELLPDVELWTRSLDKELRVLDVSPLLALTANLGGAPALLPPHKGTAASDATGRWDARGLSRAARLATYATRLVRPGDATADGLSPEVLALVATTAELAADQAALAASAGLYRRARDVDDDFVTSARALINRIAARAPRWRDPGPAASAGAGDDSALVHALFAGLLQRSRAAPDVPAFYAARALASLVQALVDAHGFPTAAAETWLAGLDVLKSGGGTSLLPGLALLHGLGEVGASSPAVKRLCNNLVSDVATAKQLDGALLPSLVQLDLCAAAYPSGQLPVANPRIVMAVKRIAGWLDGSSSQLTANDRKYASHLARVLLRLLPDVSHIYDTFWASIIRYFCGPLWAESGADPKTVALPNIHASLKLMAFLETLRGDNDDVADALDQTSKTRAENMLGLLQTVGAAREDGGDDNDDDDDSPGQAAAMVEALLRRQVGKMPASLVDDVSDLFPLLASPSRDVQTAAFQLTHRAIPLLHERDFLRIHLDEDDARLPDELLSLLLEPPTLERYPDEEALARFPTPLRGYLLSWHLVFDYFAAGSASVVEGFTDHLRQQDAVGPLLDFAFDVLGHSAGHPLNLDREGITPEMVRAYDADAADAEQPEKDLHWLLAHLAYACLRSTPGLFKAWYLACQVKQTRQTLEPWVGRFLSPGIVADSFAEIERWKATAAETEGGDGTTTTIEVKVSESAMTVAASYRVDEQFATILMRVPPAYPLEPVVVESVSRVGVSEQKWATWLRAVQGVVTFTNGSLLDGLICYNRNFSGFLNGKSECAICYAIIGEDRTFPNKKCGTCNNSFHKGCLFKWFLSSNRNTCPLCRNPISMVDADKRRLNRR